VTGCIYEGSRKVVLAWVFMATPAEEVGRFVYITLHKSIGQTIFFLTLVRLIWRRSHPAPPVRGRIAVWGVAIARLNHWLLYAVMILMPVTGYVLATAAARPSPYFWLFYWPQPAVSAVVAHAALRAHLVGQYFVYTMVGLHVSAVVWHVVVRRDGLLNECFLPSRTRKSYPPAVEILHLEPAKISASLEALVDLSDAPPAPLPKPRDAIEPLRLVIPTSSRRRQ
jgi:cytochrome b561